MSKNSAMRDMMQIIASAYRGQLASLESPFVVNAWHVKLNNVMQTHFGEDWLAICEANVPSDAPSDCDHEWQDHAGLMRRHVFSVCTKCGATMEKVGVAVPVDDPPTGELDP